MTEGPRYATAIAIRALACLGFALTAPIASTVAGSVHGAVPLHEARRQCFSTLESHLPVWSGAPHQHCRVTWARLGQIEGTRLFRGQYVWPSNETPELMVVTEVLLEAPAAASRLNPIFATQEDQTYVYLDPFTLHSVSGRKLVEVRGCLNGTGGCKQDFLEYKAGKLTPIINTVPEQVQQ